MSTRAKTRYVAEHSLYAFARRNPLFYFWTNTFAEDVTKAEAERRFKPLRDLLDRRGFKGLFFWERTQKGRWHLHWVVDHYIDVNRLRPWLVARGWGQQMVVRRVEASPARFDGNTWRSDESAVRGVVLYLIKYCTKSLVDSEGTKKRVFTASSGVKLGTVAFSWVPWVNPTSMLYAAGKAMWIVIHGHLPKWGSFREVVRLGVEVSDWLQVDPWCAAVLRAGWLPEHDRLVRGFG